MPRRNTDSGPDGGTNKLVWWIMGIIGAAVSAILVLMLNGASNRLSAVEQKAGTLSVDVAKLEGRLNAVETRATDLATRISALETKLDRVRNPRPWETSAPRR